jgi:hypothetical protein
MALLWANAGASLTADAEGGIEDGHHFALTFSFLFVVDKLAVFVEGSEGKHTTATDFEATATAEAAADIQAFDKLWDPGQSAFGESSCSSHSQAPKRDF